MKKVLLLLLFVASILVAAAQCYTPPAGSPNLFPENDLLPCIIRDVEYSAMLHFQLPDSTTVSGIKVKIEYLIIDSIKNLPCSIYWGSNKPNNRWESQESGCIHFKGKSNYWEGQYKLEFKTRVKVNVLPNIVPYSLETFGFRVDLRVRDKTKPCINIDTSENAILQHSCYYQGLISSNTTFNSVRGKVFVDTDGNGIFDGNDYGLPNYRVNISSDNYTFTNTNGDYVFVLPVGNYVVSPDTNAYYSLSSDSTQFPFIFTAVGVDYPDNDFGFSVVDTINDLSVSINRVYIYPGNSGSYRVDVANLGNMKATTNATLIFDTAFTVNGTSPLATSLSAGEATWAITDLLPGQTKSFYLHVTTPIELDKSGDTVLAIATLDASIPDDDLGNNIFTDTIIFYGTGVDDKLDSKQGHISLYPNPATSTITIEHQSWANGTTLLLMDLSSGKVLLTQPLTSNRTELNTNGLPNGMYLYRVVGANGTEGMGKVVVAK